MAINTLTQSTALMYEKVREKISLLYPRETTFSDLIDRIENDLVSTRAMRIPVQMFSGSQFAQTTLNGSNTAGFPNPSATDYEVFVTTPVAFVQSTGWSLDSAFATESSEQAVTNFAKRELKNALKEFACYTDVLCQQDSSGTIDTVQFISANSVYIAVSNPNRFRANGTYQIVKSDFSVQRGTFQVQSVDPLGGRIYITGAVLPSTGGATVVGDLIAIAGAPGTGFGTSLNGLAYLHQDPGNTGSYLGLTVSSFPGMLRTPHVAAGGQALTAELGYSAIQKLRLVLGAEADRDFKWYTGVDQEQNINQAAIQVQQVILNQVSGDKSVDPVKYDAPSTFVGRPITVSLSAAPGRMDALMLKHWLKSSVIEGGGDPVPLSWSGVTEWPQYSSGGGSLLPTTMTFLISYWQMALDNRRAGMYIDGLPIPATLPLGSLNAG